MNIDATLLELAQNPSRLRGYLTDAFRQPLSELEGRLLAPDGPAPVDELCVDFFASGGKRLRAVAALCVGRALGVEDTRAVELAEVVELSHGATLLHDDVIDEADTRRGRQSARRRWTNTLSVLGGDFLLLRSLEAVSRLGAPELAAAHRRTLFSLLESEVAQHQSRRQGDLCPESYVAIAEGKTGSLFAFACAAPAHLLGDLAAGRLLEAFGRNFGVAFQIADDVRDLTGGDPGKPGCLDLTDGIFSLPLRLAARHDADLAQQLRRSVDDTPDRQQLVQLAGRVLRSGAVAEAAKQGRTHLHRGRRRLAALPFADALWPLDALCAWLDRQLQEMEG